MKIRTSKFKRLWPIELFLKGKLSFLHCTVYVDNDQSHYHHHSALITLKPAQVEYTSQEHPHHAPHHCNLNRHHHRGQGHGHGHANTHANAM